MDSVAVDDIAIADVVASVIELLVAEKMINWTVCVERAI